MEGEGAKWEKKEREEVNQVNKREEESVRERMRERGRE